jgi:hypothetical protein
MSREEMRKLMEAVKAPPKTKKQTASNFQFDSKGAASFEGYPVYMLSDKSGDSYAFFAFAGTKSNLKDLQVAIKSYNKWLTAEYEQDYDDSRGTIGSMYYDEEQEAGLDLYRATKEEIGRMEEVPVVKEIAPRQLKKVDTFYYQLVSKTNKERAKGRKAR